MCNKRQLGSGLSVRYGSITCPFKIAPTYDLFAGNAPLQHPFQGVKLPSDPPQRHSIAQSREVELMRHRVPHSDCGYR